MHHRQAVIVLSALGLLPFYLAVLIMLLGYDGIGGNLINYYSLAIICFIAGSWWGFALAGRAPSARIAILLVSNLIVVGAVAAVALLPAHYCLMLLAALLFSQLVIEATLSGLTRQPAYYRRLRRIVTMLAIVAQGAGASLLAAS